MLSSLVLWLLPSFLPPPGSRGTPGVDRGIAGCRGRSRAPPVADSARRKPAWCVRCASASLGAPRISVPRLKKGDDAEPSPLAPCEKIPLSFLSINPPPPPIFLHLHHSKPLSPPAPLLRSVLSLLGSASRPLTFPRPTPTAQSSEKAPCTFHPEARRSEVSCPCLEIAFRRFLTVLLLRHIISIEIISNLIIWRHKLWNRSTIC